MSHLTTSSFLFFLGGLMAAPSWGQLDPMVPAHLPSLMQKVQAVKIHYIDRMDPVRSSKTESMFGTIDSPPSRLLAVRGPFGHEDAENKEHGKGGLKLICELQPNVERSWTAYYTNLKKGDAYFDASRFNYLSFWIRGEAGEEKIQVGLVDKQHEEAGTFGDTGTIEAYTQRGIIDKEWQQVKIPIDIFHVNTAELYQVLIFFDSKLYESAEPRNITIYLDDLAFE